MAALCWCLSDNQQTQQTQLWTHCARCVSCQLTVKLHINTFTYTYISYQGWVVTVSTENYH